MNFINPKTDFGFKKIFASPQHKEVLISFLNAMLYNAEPTIQDLEIIDPYAAPAITGLKDTYLDVRHLPGCQSKNYRRHNCNHRNAGN
ncbi:PD-(D/E)XK nuclease family transposase [Microcoleus sp. PH2017_37_MFU_D_B]|uniref:PD-(D/E)XK nuclease family transposase n=1 Tax=Microcoleus sp. PH2017_37_MFU_D_B TaxID=2798847 RepID=UPI00345DCA10